MFMPSESKGSFDLYDLYSFTFSINNSLKSPLTLIQCLFWFPETARCCLYHIFEFSRSNRTCVPIFMVLSAAVGTLRESAVRSRFLATDLTIYS